MSKAVKETIVVTGKKLSTAGATGGGFAAPTLLSYIPQPAPDVFEQEGGKETARRFSRLLTANADK